MKLLSEDIVISRSRYNILIFLLILLVCIISLISLISLKDGIFDTPLSKDTQILNS
ncbi:hypothetical protein [Microseira sp. BLCC-F43]|uniref:hypothetical protein n=1 Tax=Microseira sp. BLCC-F43 TaxID=3153602 RepID=UPI0035B7C44B